MITKSFFNIKKLFSKKILLSSVIIFIFSLVFISNVFAATLVVDEIQFV